MMFVELKLHTYAIIQRIFTQDSSQEFLLTQTRLILVGDATRGIQFL